MQGTMPDARRRGRPRTAWMDNIKTWTGLSVEESIRMKEDRDKWRKYVPWCGQPSDRGRLKNRTEQGLTGAIGVNATGDTSPAIFGQPEPGTKYLISPAKFVCYTA